MKKYVITLSKVYHKKHSKAGQETNFKRLLEDGIKKHTIRQNYDFWAKRFKNIATGDAVLSIRQWSGLPYRSKQEVICELGKDDGIGLTAIYRTRMLGTGYHVNGSTTERYSREIAKNDGLDEDDFIEWFSKVPPIEPCALIYLTNFRYT